MWPLVSRLPRLVPLCRPATAPLSTSRAAPASLLSRVLGSKAGRTGVLAVKVGVALEVASLLVCWAGYHRINTDPELRFQLATSPRWYAIVELYYKLGETIDKDCPIRQNDLALWRAQGKIWIPEDEDK